MQYMGSLCGSFIHFISNTVFNLTPLVTVFKHFETRDLSFSENIHLDCQSLLVPAKLYWRFKVPIHRLATTLKPFTVAMNKTDHLTAVQYSDGEPWILVFMWTPIDRNHPLKQPCRLSAPWLALAHPEDIGSPAGQCVLPHPRNCSGAAWGRCQRASGIHMASKESKSDWATWDKMLLAWGGFLCLKQYLGWFYGSKNIFMNTRTKAFPLEHCPVDQCHSLCQCF